MGFGRKCVSGAGFGESEKRILNYFEAEFDELEMILGMQVEAGKVRGSYQEKWVWEGNV